MSALNCKRVLLKLSGEALSNNNGFGIDVDAIKPVIDNIAKAIKDHGVELAIVIGGGNFLRGGRAVFKNKINRNTADQMGMLATMINGLALRDILISSGIKAVVFSAKGIDGLLDPVDTLKAKKLLTEGYVVVFSGGTGNPFVTTDTASSLRAVEIEADSIFKATTVNGVYNADPNKNLAAKKYDHITFTEVLQKELAVMDIAAFAQCKEFNIPICVFNLDMENVISRVLSGEHVGTWVTGDNKND
ncbi:UMP kinase [Francisellaceae bacterium]|nr:UMP kinase [Francisellaceae bacterium]